MVVKAVPSLFALLVLVSLLSRATFGQRGRAAQPPALDVVWGADDTLVVLGSGFEPGERVAFTLTLRRHEERTATGPGIRLESRQSVSQSSSTTLVADDNGAFRFASTIVAPSDAELQVTASGDRGSSAAVSRLLADIPR
jgi:hypothetical protein